MLTRPPPISRRREAENVHTKAVVVPAITPGIDKGSDGQNT